MEPKVLITRIKTALERLAQLCAGISDEQLHGNQMLQESLLWNLQVVSIEAVDVPRDFQLLHPEVDWGILERLRQTAAPEYYKVDWAALLRTLHKSVPQLLAQVGGILSSLN